MNRENEKIWYIFDQGVVSGPYQRDQVQKLVDEGHHPLGIVWKKGRTEWEFLNTWAATQKVWKDTWYVASEGIHNGPFSLDEIARKMVAKEWSPEICLWTSGLKNWIGVYEVSELVEKLGLSKRKHLRAPFVGDVRIRGFLKKQKVTAYTLSLGGIGLTGLNMVNTGEKLSVTIKSDLLKESISTKVKVVYQNETSVGLEFQNLGDAAEQVVQDYIRLFQIPDL